MLIIPQPQSAELPQQTKWVDSSKLHKTWSISSKAIVGIFAMISFVSVTPALANSETLEGIVARNQSWVSQANTNDTSPDIYPNEPFTTQTSEGSLIWVLFFWLVAGVSLFIALRSTQSLKLGMRVEDNVQEMSNQRQNQPAIDANLGLLSKTVPAKAMFDGFEKRFYRPRFAPQ
jgi:hypothetical protein